MNLEKSSHQDKRILKFFLGLISIIYVILFPFFLIATCYYPWYCVWDNPKMTLFRGVIYIILFFCFPFSMVVGTEMAWSRFNRKKYKQAIFFCMLPVIVYVFPRILDRIR